MKNHWNVAIITGNTMVILSSIDLAFAAPSISIETSQSVYEYGDHLNIIIKVSEITGGDAYIYIINTEERKSLLRTVAQFLKNILNSHHHFLLNLVLQHGLLVHMVLNLNIQELNLQHSLHLKIQERLDYHSWIKDLAKMWITDLIYWKGHFSVAIEYMINSEIIKIPYTESDDVSATTIPEWIKNNAGWWAVEGKISDDRTFTMALQYLVKTGIITVNLTSV